MLPKTRVYLKIYDEQTKWKQFLIKDEDLLEKYKVIWDKVSVDIYKKEFDSEHVYSKEFFKNQNKVLW